MFLAQAATAASIPAPTGAWAVVGAVLAGVGGLGGLAGFGALMNAKASGRKTDAEAEQARAAADNNEADAATKITDAALRLLDPVQQQVAELRGRVGQLESDQRTQHMLLVEHSVWDHLALARMKDAGVELPPIPPLFPKNSTTVTVEVTQPDA